VRGVQGRRCKQPLGDLNETRGYCKLKEDALRSRYVEHSLWKNSWSCRKTDY
jgi:hypothetical protein